MIVGYSGLVIIARTGDSRLDKLACVNDLFVAVTDHVRADGWRIGFLGAADDTSPDELAHALAAQTAAPAIALSVFDSDCAWATAADPSGATVDFCLNEQIIAALTDDVDNYKPVNPQAVAGLLRWATNASLTASPEHLEAALRDSPGPFGDGILRFAEALGIAQRPG